MKEGVKMKKRIGLIFIFIIALAMAGCGNDLQEDTANQQQEANDEQADEVSVEEVNRAEEGAGSHIIFIREMNSLFEGADDISEQIGILRNLLEAHDEYLLAADVEWEVHQMYEDAITELRESLIAQVEGVVWRYEMEAPDDTTYPCDGCCNITIEFLNGQLDHLEKLLTAIENEMDVLGQQNIDNWSQRIEARIDYLRNHINSF